jgi:5-methylcytosine-specific restriction enzyme A
MRYPSAKPEYHRFYKLKLWCHVPTGLRWCCLVKALFRCSRCGWQAKASETHLLVANHIKPHKGDMALFSDPTNLTCICKPCHDSAVQSQERTGHVIGVDLTGAPIDPSHPWNR